MIGERESLWQRIKREMVFRLAWFLSTAIAATVRVRVDGWERLQNVISEGAGGLVTPWHGVTMLPIYYCRKMGLYSMVSVSRDGELQNRILRSRGFTTIRGSTGRHGARALLESVRRIREGGVMAYTPDGPKGPARKVQPGAVHIAQRSGCPVLPVGVACRPCFRAHSWDSHMVPAPFARAVIAFGEPLHIAPGEPEEDAALRIENAINDAERRAYQLLDAQGSG